RHPFGTATLSHPGRAQVAPELAPGRGGWCQVGLDLSPAGACTDLDRVELMARRLARFTREEAVYWLSRTTSFGSDANRWAIAGLRIMLGGHAKEPAVERMLERLRAI